MENSKKILAEELKIDMYISDVNPMNMLLINV
jgi:hypothetical protein